MRLRLPRTLAVALVAAAVPGLILAQQEGRTRPRAGTGAEAKGKMKGQRAEGVIVKVEPVTKGASEGSTTDRLAKEGRQPARSVRITINTAAVWRDFVRDTASLSARPNPEKGKTSIATQGQPASPDTLAVVDIGPDTQIESRVRASTDEASDGARSIEGAEKKASDPNDDPAPRKKARRGARRTNDRAPRMHASDLKAGLWVIADYRHANAQNHASRVLILKPVGGADTPPDQAAPPARKDQGKDQ